MSSQSVITVHSASNLPNQASGPASAFATVNILSPGEQPPSEGISTPTPVGSKTGVVPQNPNPTWNTQIPVTQALQNGSKALVTVWHKDDAQGMCTKVGRVFIDLPPRVGTVKQNLEDDEGVVIEGANGVYAPITVGFIMPGQPTPNSSQFVNKSMSAAPSGRSARLLASQMEGRGYTSEQIKRVLQRQKDKIVNEERNLKADINDELLRMAEEEERNPFKGIRDVGSTLPPSRQVDDLFMEPAGRPFGPGGPSAVLDGMPIFSESEDPFGGLIGRTAPLPPAMPPYMSAVGAGGPGYMPMSPPPMSGTQYMVDQPMMAFSPQPAPIRVPAPIHMRQPQQFQAPPPMAPPGSVVRIIQRGPGPGPGPMMTMPPPGPPQPMTIMAGTPGPQPFFVPQPMRAPMHGPPPMPMGMGGPMMMGAPMGAPQPPFLRPYDDHDLSGEHF